MAFSLDGLLASASADKSIKLWATDFRCQATLQGHVLSVSAVAFHEKRLASASWDKSVCVWDVVTEQVVRRLQGHTDWVHAVAWAPGVT